MVEFKRPGEIVCELTPSKGNPRNSEGAFITLNDGTILFIYSRFTGKGCNDDGEACIASIKSFDNGETWTNPQTIFTSSEHKAKNLMSVSLLRMRNGDIGLFYLIRKGWYDTRLCIRRSSDEGRVWSKSEYITSAKGYYETNNDRVVRLSSGRIIVPSAHYRVPMDYEYNSSKIAFRGEALFFISDDDGYTWRESQQTLSMPIPRSRSGLQETGVIELLNGDLWAWFRTDMCYQYESYSHDRGDSWTQPQPSIFMSPCSPLSMKRFPDSKVLCAVFNTNPGNNYRNPFILLHGNKNARDWENPLILEDINEIANYCYTAIHFIDKDNILLAYSAGENEKNKYSMDNLRIVKIDYRKGII